MEIRSLQEIFLFLYRYRKGEKRVKEFLITHLGEFIFALISAIVTTIATVWIKSEHDAKVKAEVEAETKIAEKEAEYKRLLKEEQTRQYRNMIVDEINPLVEEIHRIKAHADEQIKEVEKHIKDDEHEFDNRINDLKKNYKADNKAVNNKIVDLTKKHEDDLGKIIESYKFRFIQLCKTHLKDGHITPEEWEQIVTFYDLYHSLGGNGQAEEYYEQVKKLVGNKISG